MEGGGIGVAPECDRGSRMAGGAPERPRMSPGGDSAATTNSCPPEIAPLGRRLEWSARSSGRGLAGTGADSGCDGKRIHGAREAPHSFVRLAPGFFLMFRRDGTRTSAQVVGRFTLVPTEP